MDNEAIERNSDPQFIEFERAIKFLLENPKSFRLISELPNNIILLIHAFMVFKASNIIRKKIENGYYSTNSLLSVFIQMHSEYFDPKNQLAQRLASYNAKYNQEALPKLELFPVKITMLSSRSEPTYGKEKDYGIIRDFEINVFTLDLEGNISIMGSPSEIVEQLTKIFFEKLENYIPNMAKNNDYSLQIVFSAAAATILDNIHCFGDGNGRTSEDFMVELQRRLFQDITKVKTWSTNGIRAYGLTNKNVKFLNISRHKEYNQRIKLIDKRSAAMIKFRSLLGEKFLNKLLLFPDLLEDSDKVLLESYINKKSKNIRFTQYEIESLKKVLEKYFYKYPYIIEEVYVDIIDSIDSWEGLIKNNFFGEGMVGDILMQESKTPYNYTQVALSEFSPSDLNLSQIISDIERNDVTISSIVNIIYSNIDESHTRWEELLLNFKELHNDLSKLKELSFLILYLLLPYIEYFDRTLQEFNTRYSRSFKIYKYFNDILNDMGDNTTSFEEIFRLINSFFTENIIKIKSSQYDLFKNVFNKSDIDMVKLNELFNKYWLK